VQPPQADPMLGTWKLSLEKSKYDGVPTPKSRTVTWAAQAGGMMKLTIDQMDTKGQSTRTEWVGKIDGKDYPVTGGVMLDTVSFKRIDALTIEFTQKKEGKVIVTTKAVISKDGKTHTSAWTGTDEKGKARSWTMVHEKQ
jgi:hypothetical protein